MTFIPENFSQAGFRILPSQSAAPSYDHTGRFIWSGRKSHRLIIEDLNHPEFHIALTKITYLKAPYHAIQLASKKYAAIQINQETFAVNLNSLSQRLHLPKASVLEAAQQKSLFQLLTASKASISVLPYLIQSYREIVARYTIVDGHELKHSDHPELKLNKPLLMKVLTVAMEKFSTAIENPTVDEQNFISVNDQKWLVEVKEGQLQLHNWTFHKANAHKIWNVSKACFSSFPYLVKIYQEILSRYQIVDGHELTHSDHPQLKLNKPLLMKVLTVAMEKFSTAIENPTVDEQDFISVDEQDWLVEVKDGRLKLFDWTFHKFDDFDSDLFKDKLVEVYKIWNVSQACFMALKKYNDNYKEDPKDPSKSSLKRHKSLGEEKIIREYSILSHLNQHKPHLGIQLAPKLYLEKIFNKQSKTSANGFLGMCYKTDYFSLTMNNPSPSLSSLLPALYQLLYGLNRLHKHGVMHNDIKMENIFCHDKYLFISDFGGARILSKQDGQIYYDAEVKMIDYSTNYISLKDYVELVKAQEKKNWEEYAETAFALDVLATGVCCYAAITGQFPYLHIQIPYGEKVVSFLDTNAPWYSSTLKQMGIPEEIIDLLDSMLEPDWKRRASAYEAFKTFQNYIRDKHLDIMTEINTLKDNLNNYV